MTNRIRGGSARRSRDLLQCGFAVFVCAAAIVGWSCRSRNAIDDEARAAVREAVEELILADNTRDLDRVLASYRADAVLLPPDGPAVRGREAIASRYRDLFREFDPDLEVSIDGLGVSPEWAWCRGTTTGRLVPRSDAAESEPRTINDKFLMILSPYGDGSWAIDTLMWSPVTD